MQQQEITAMQATPSTWRLLFEAGWKGASNFKVLTGGEALPQNLAEELCAAAGSVWNMYGPTETTVWSTVARVQPGVPVTLGKPIANTVLRIADAAGADTAVGVPGELLIGGEGVTLGYWRRPELNAERFLVKDGVRYYRTGDLVRLTASGALVYLGRMDNQVKLRGYRIELGEIESRLAELREIAEAAVVVQSFGDADQRLTAFYRLRPQAAIDLSQLRAHMAATLPSFMVPQQFIALEQFPQTPNGKVDRKALTAHTGVAIAAPVTSSAGEEQAHPVLLEQFRHFLQQPQLPANADFFQYGGHSLLAMRMVAEINKQLDSALTLTELFQAPTAASLSALLEAKLAKAPTQIPRKASRDRFLMSLQQRRLWYLEKLEQTSVEYNLPACWRFHGDMNVGALQQAVDTLVERHEALRTSLVEEGDGLFQRVHPPRTGILDVVEVGGADPLAQLHEQLAERKAYR
ncbi:antibiotic synthetase, putative, partial [Ricinus communis]